MKIQKIFSFALVFGLILNGFVNVAFAEEPVAPGLNLANVDGTQESCNFDWPEERVYDAKLITVRRKLKLDSGEVFRVKIFMKNTGNMPWFSSKSRCNAPNFSLGTERPKDHRSALYSPTIEGLTDTGWEANNRISMDQLRTDPGQIASFTFWVKASAHGDVYKEYLKPIVEAVKWIDKAESSYEVVIGDVKENPANLRQKMLYAVESGSVTGIDLNAERSLLVDLSDQLVYLKLGDRIIRIFRVSTGKSATPTPTGNTYISVKQEVRVAHSRPHYIMPKFMMFRAGGYGFHALPSLSYDGGYFWTEARNHIGIPVSHGCIRLLPEDADFMYDFTPIGTKVTIQY